MVQLIFFGLVGIAGWYGYKAIKKEMDKVSEKVRKAEDKQAGVEEVGELEQDPETGVYKVKKD